MIGSAAKVCMENDVWMPKLPPPPPRQAQNKSGFSVALSVLICPSAVTISLAINWSQPRPCSRMFKPMPPPSRKPAAPTVSNGRV